MEFDIVGGIREDKDAVAFCLHNPMCAEIHLANRDLPDVVVAWRYPGMDDLVRVDDHDIRRVAGALLNDRRRYRIVAQQAARGDLATPAERDTPLDRREKRGDVDVIGEGEILVVLCIVYDLDADRRGLGRGRTRCRDRRADCQFRAVRGESIEVVMPMLADVDLLDSTVSVGECLTTILSGDRHGHVERRPGPVNDEAGVP